MRDDIRGIIRCPQEIADYLLMIGGPAQNPDKEPMWRLVLASSIVWKVAGGKIWDENLTVAECGGINIDAGEQHSYKPLRDESGGLVEQRRYPHLEGWVLQKWFPPSKYSQAEWFAPENLIPFTSIPKLGPYPQFGDYEIMAGPVPRVPTMSELRTYIASYWQGMESRCESVNQRILEAHNAAVYQKDQDEQRTRNLVEEYGRDVCSYLKSSSLAAGRLRTKRAEKLFIREHVGA